MTSDELPYEPRRITVTLASGPLQLWTPAGTDAILEALVDAPPDPDDKMPYWADLRPSALALATAVDVGLIPVAGRRVLELGAGLGLAALAAARQGAVVHATDWDEDALRYVGRSAAANGLEVQTARLDWRSPDPTFAAPIVLAADVLYEARNVPDLVRAFGALVAPGGQAWLADPGRAHLPDFIRAMVGWTFAHTVRTADHRTPAGEIRPTAIELFCIRRGRYEG